MYRIIFESVFYLFNIQYLKEVRLYKSEHFTDYTHITALFLNINNSPSEENETETL